LIKALEVWMDYVQINKKTCQVRTEEAKEQIVIQELTNQVQKLTADAADKDKAMDELQSVLRSKEQQLEQLLELLGKQDLQGPPATAI
jgi:peptidoglycan hydrolase CwlO-like protein